MIALNFDALGGNNYSHLDTSSFCLLYIDRRDNETHLPTRCWWLNEPIRLPLRSPSFRLCKFLPPAHLCIPLPRSFLSLRSYCVRFDSIRFLSIIFQRDETFFPSKFSERKGRRNRIFFSHPWLVCVSMSCQQKKHFTTGVVTVGIERVPFSYSLNGVCGPRFTFVHKSNAHVSNCELCTPSLLPLNRSFFRTAVIKFRISDIGCQPMKFSLQKNIRPRGVCCASCRRFAQSDQIIIEIVKLSP